MPEKLLTPKELAENLGVKISTIYYWSHIGYVPSVKLGRLLRFRKDSIARWIVEREKCGRERRTENVKLEDFKKPPNRKASRG